MIFFKQPTTTSSDRNTVQDNKVDFYISLEYINMINFQSEQESVGILLSLQNSHVCMLSACSLCFSLVRDKVDHIEHDIAVVPHVQVSVFWAVGEHCQHSTWRPQVKGHIDWLSLQQIKSKSDSGVFGVSDIQDTTGDEGIASLGARVCGVYVGCDGEGLLVQLGNHDALIYTGCKNQPQAIFIC